MAPAGLWPRFAALLIDVALFCSAFFPITRMVKGVWLMSPSDHRWHDGMMITDPLCIIFLGIVAIYYVLLEGLAGTTVGKSVMGLRIVDSATGDRPGLRRAFVRNALRLIDGLPAFNLLGVYLIVTDVQHARFGDRVARTRVMRNRK